MTFSLIHSVIWSDDRKGTWHVKEPAAIVPEVQAQPGVTPEEKAIWTTHEVVVIPMIAFCFIFRTFLLKCWSNLYKTVSIADYLLFWQAIENVLRGE